ncbi:MAG: adenylyltransferase/cytidyltransferase family protein [Candidatus Pacebacteria bacterium]|nr:adenylyltransferase/cytidyltransferase family protein [Candidatus Paceibacterota bacterium]
MKNKKVKVLVTGVFDLLHEEHLTFLKKAKDLGDYLVVGVESDKRVKEIKGEHRPIHSQDQRVEVIKKENIADEVIILPEHFSSKDDHIAFIKSINPDVLAVSSHTAHLDKKEAIMRLFGGRVEVIHDHNPKISTTIILQK